MPVSLTRSVGFRATHRYFKPQWSAEENRNRFGGTADEPGHPHDYRCSVTVTGLPDRETDMILDLPELDRILVPGRAKSVAFTELENASMWSHKAIAENAPVVHE